MNMKKGTSIAYALERQVVVADRGPFSDLPMIKIFKLVEKKGSYTPKATWEEYGSNQYFEARNLACFDV
jgi:hypothetical protein